MDLLSVLLDPENKEPLVLSDGNGRRLEFEQVAIIPYNAKLYCVLKPLDKVEGIADDEAVVFRLEGSDGEEHLEVETDELVAISVFDEYYKLLEENWKKG